MQKIDPDIVKDIIQNLTLKAGELRYLCATTNDNSLRDKLTTAAQSISENALMMAEWLAEEDNS